MRDVQRVTMQEPRLALLERRGSLILIGMAAGSAVGVGTLLVRLPPAGAGAIVIAVMAILVLTFILKGYGTRGLSSVTLVAAVVTLGMKGIRLSTSVALSDLFFLSAALILLPRLLAASGMERLAPVKRLVGGTMLIVLGGLLGSILAENPAGSLTQLLRFTVAAVLVPVLIALWKPSFVEIRRLSWCWVISVTISAVVAIGEIGTARHGRADGLTTHPNHLALTCVMAVGPAIALTLLSRGLERTLGLLSCMALGAGLLISGSRAGAVGLILTLTSMMVLTRRLAVSGGFAATAVASVAILFTGVVELPAGNTLARLIGTGDQEVARGVGVSDAGRRELLSAGFDRVFSNPLTGSGFENALVSHDIYLQLWASAGVLGLVGMSIVITALLNVPARGLFARTRPVSPPAILLMGSAASYFGYLVAGLFQNALWDRYLWLTPSLIAVLTPIAVGTLSFTRSRSNLRALDVPIGTDLLQPVQRGLGTNARSVGRGQSQTAQR
jgi:O-antigen ligase